MTSYVTSRDGTRIAYNIEGHGSPVILVAGAMQFRGFDSNTVDMAKKLSEYGHQVINYDRRGRGESFNTPSCTLAESIDDIKALASQVDGPVALFGNSSGAAISLAAAAAGVEVSALMLWEAPLGEELGTDGAQNLKGLQEKLAAGNPDAVIEYFMKDMPAEWLEGAKQSPGWPVMTAMGPSLEADAEALAWTQSAPRKQLWAGIAAPVVALVGEHTIPIMPPAAMSIAENVPHGIMESMPGENHGWDSGVMAKRIADFLAENGV